MSLNTSLTDIHVAVPVNVLEGQSQRPFHALVLVLLLCVAGYVLVRQALEASGVKVSCRRRSAVGPSSLQSFSRSSQELPRCSGLMHRARRPSSRETTSRSWAQLKPLTSLTGKPRSQSASTNSLTSTTSQWVRSHSIRGSQYERTNGTFNLRSEKHHNEHHNPNRPAIRLADL